MGRKKKINAKYSPEFKISVIMDMRKNHLGYMETVRKYWGKEINANNYYPTNGRVIHPKWCTFLVHKTVEL